MKLGVVRRAELLYAATLAALVSLFFGSVAVGDDKPAPPHGLRVFYTGHSFHMFVPQRVEQLVKAAGILGHQLVGTQSIGGSQVIQHWNLEDEKNRAKPALESGKVDVFTMSPHLFIPDRGIENFVELGLKHNANVRFLVQGSWFPFDTLVPGKRITDNAQRDTMTVADLEGPIEVWRVKMEEQVDALNAKHGKRCVYIVPVGKAVLELRRQIIAGEFPGIDKQSTLFRDAIGHGNGHIMALTAYCNYAVIYNRSPEGLKLDEPGVTDEQHKMLQQIAWETVQKYPPACMNTPATSAGR